MVKFSDNSGDTLEDAIIIQGAKNPDEGVAAEYDYLKKTFGEPGLCWFFIEQSVIPTGDKCFDKFILKDNHDNRFEVYFDITDFFGK